MTALTGSLGCPPDLLAATRDGLHRVAEHVLAAARYAASGRIGLVPSPGGFQTPPFGADGSFLAVDGTELVAGDATGSRRATLTTIRAAAEFGAARTWHQIGTVAEAAAFFRDARAHVTTPARRTS